MLPLWLTYTEKISIEKKSMIFDFNGGTETVKIRDIHSIMFYGTVCDLSQKFLEQCAVSKIPIVIHRRNMTQGVWIQPSITSNREDVLSKQILFRENKKKCSYITKRLLLAKFESMKWLLPPPYHDFRNMTNIQEMRLVEAWHAKKYWELYYSLANQKNNTRRGENSLSACLDAASKFISGVLLRWICFHHLSPNHGFTHIPTDYPALVYDLMEPFRGYVDKVVFDTYQQLKPNAKKNKMPIIFASLKNALNSTVYVHATRQTATFQELYHGLVLALRSYLLGNKRFIVPMINKPKGGRPIKAGYNLYGRKAGIIDCWSDAKEVTKKSLFL